MGNFEQRGRTMFVAFKKSMNRHLKKAQRRGGGIIVANYTGSGVVVRVTCHCGEEIFTEEMTEMDTIGVFPPPHAHGAD